MQLFHRSTSLSATFDETNLVSAAGLVPAMALAVKAGLSELADKWLTVPDYFGANAGLKVTALVAGMLAGADSIDDMAILRHGGMKKLFVGAYAPSTLGSFLRAFTFGPLRQLDAVAWRWLVNVATVAPIAAGIDEYALVDIDDTIKEVHGYQKQGSGYGVFQGARVERAAGDRFHGHDSTDHHRVPAPQRRSRIPARGGQVRRRHSRHRPPTAFSDRVRAGAAAR